MTIHCQSPQLRRLANNITNQATAANGRVRGQQRGQQIARDEPDGVHHNKRRTGSKRIADRVHGDPLGEKDDSCVRFVFENFNGLAPWYIRNDKIILARRFLHRIKADCYMGAECRAQWDILRHANKLEQLFKSEVQIKAIASHNIHEDDTRAQEGGTAIITFDQLANLQNSAGVDRTGLGRWSWIKIKGKHNHVTRIICAYQPCTSKRTSLSSVGAQHRRYLRNKGIKDCPRLAFRKGLTAKLSKWIRAKERLILFLDANENIATGPLSKEFAKLGLRELVRERTNQPGPSTHSSGQYQIDGVFATVEIDCAGARFLPFWSGIGDHRALVVDIPQQVLYGEQLLRIVRPKGRKLQCYKTPTKEKYLQGVKGKTQLHKIEKKIHLLTEIASYPPTEHYIKSQNQIDIVQRDVMRSAENKCRNWHMGEVDFSPQVMIWWHRRLTWKLLCDYHHGRNISTTLITRRARACGIIDPLESTPTEADKAYKICKTQFEKMKPRAAIYRRDFLRKQIKDYKANGNVFQAARLKVMQTREKSSSDWRRINSAWAQRSGGCVTKVSIQLNNDKIELTKQIPIEEAIMENNDKRFRLPYGTPMLDGSSLQKDLGLLSTTEAATQILGGTYHCEDDVEEETKRLIAGFSKVFDKARNLNFNQHISAQDYTTYWRGRKEKTSSSYSKLHFGHWIACADSPYLASLHAKRIELAFRSGAPLHRWQSGLSVMLEKVAGVNLVDKLRAILLMEADFNFANSLYFGKRALDSANKQDLITHNTFGSKRNSCPIEVPICRLMFFDMVRQMKRNASLGSFDAQTCYDRIAHSFLSLVAQAVGTPQPLIVCMLKAIQNMKLYLRTGYGDSDRYYCSKDILQPYQGAVQGNGAAPTLWLLISSFLLKYMEGGGHFLNIKSALTATRLVFIALMFVDDTDFPIYAESPQESISSVAQRQQSTVNSWSHGLTVSGGSLKPEKCFWYPIEWTWKNGIAKATPAKDIEEDIEVKDPDGHMEKITKLDYDSAKEILGVFQAPSGQMNSQLKKLEGIRDKFIPVLTNKYLPQELIWISFWGKLWPSLKYPLAAMSLTQTAADKFMTPLYKHLLPCLKVVRCLPLAYRYSTTKYGGLGLPNLFIEQTIARLSFLMMHGSAKTLPGQYIRHSMEILQLEVGVGTHFFHLPYSKFGNYTTSCWLSSLWQHVSNLPITIKYKQPTFLRLQRTDDRYIMEVIQNLGQPSVTNLKSINRVRLFYHSYSLADIVNGTGTDIRKSVWTRAPPLEESSFEWPRMKPSKNDFIIWEDMLKRISLYMQQQHITLGKWNLDTHVKLKCTYNQEDNSVSILENETWHQYTMQERRQSRHATTYTYHNQTNAPQVNQNRGIYSQRSPTTITFEGFSSVQQINEVHEPTLKDILQKWGDMWMWEHNDLEDDGIWLANAITDQSAMIVCDGSFQPDLTKIRGSAAWTIECTTTKKRIMGVIPSTTTTSNAYRAELTGIYVSLTYALAVCIKHKLTSGKIEIGCDNEQGIYLSSIFNDRVTTKMKHSDILRAIRTVRCSFPVKMKFTHIDGHQDDGKLYSQLDRLAQLNVDCDTLAKAALKRYHRHNTPTHDSLPHEVFIMHIRSEKVTSDIGLPLRNEVSRIQMRTFLQGNNRLDCQSFDKVDWEAMSHKMRKTPSHHKIWITKHLSGFCGTNKCQNQRDKAHATICPCCKNPDIVEDTRHILHCTDPLREELWSDSLKDLEKWLWSRLTEPTLLTSILTYIKYRGTKTFVNTIPRYSSLQALASDQDAIGWDNFIEGRISLHFREVQTKYYIEQESRSSGLKWASDLISQLFIMIRTQWLHRNAVVHKRRRDGLKIIEGNKISEKIQETLQEGGNTVDEADQYLLDHSIEEIDAWTGAKKKIWLRSMQAAKNLKRKRVEEEAENRQPPHKRRRRQHNASHIAKPRTNTRKRQHDINTTGQRKKVRKKS